MTPLMWALVAVVVMVAAAVAYQSKQKPAPVRLASAAALRTRSMFEVETDEDLVAIQEAYREDRRRERARVALERVGRIVPETSGATASGRSK